jgi:hypothetical protein
MNKGKRHKAKMGADRVHSSNHDKILLETGPQSETKHQFPVEIRGMQDDLMADNSTLTSASGGSIRAASQTTLHSEKDPELRKLYGVLADVLTGLWRMRRKTTANVSEPEEVLRSIRRHLDATWDVLAASGIEVRDYFDQKYVNGMALRLTFQPTEGVKTETITETIKPSIFYKRRLIRMGEVIVAIPMNASGESEIRQ